MTTWKHIKNDLITDNDNLLSLSVLTAIFQVDLGRVG